MKALAIIITFLFYSIFGILYFGAGGSDVSFDIPTLTIPDFNFIDLSDGCSGFTDCIEYVGAVVYNLSLGLIFLVLFIINLLVYIFQMLALLFGVLVKGVDGAPPLVNLVLVTPFYLSVGLIIYKIIRSGKDEA